MTRTDADQCRATGIWPVRPMTPFEPCRPCRPRALLGHRVLAAPLRSHGASSSRSCCSAPQAALLTCWPRDKRERHRPNCAAFCLRRGADAERLIANARPVPRR